MYVILINHVADTVQQSHLFRSFSYNGHSPYYHNGAMLPMATVSVDVSLGKLTYRVLLFLDVLAPYPFPGIGTNGMTPVAVSVLPLEQYLSLPPTNLSMASLPIKHCLGGRLSSSR
jgi:hypothetical protein